SFGILPDHDLEVMVSYVIHLSIRGKVESDLLRDSTVYDPSSGTYSFKIDEDDEDAPKTVAAAVKRLTKSVAEKSHIAVVQENPMVDTSWRFSQLPGMVIAPGEYKVKDLKESMKRGRLLFVGDEKPGGKAGICVSCHVDFGRQAKYRVDDWATLVRPNNFTQGVFRGGRRPIDIYNRVHSGINGSGMANFGSALTSDQIWDLVNFVSEGLPYPAMRKGLDIK
ncbi:MAG TPA: c-type cytochrome, partial [Gemmataceae bacterium]|nr:c-type cytochrome [Gemmataceae bacterium]